MPHTETTIHGQVLHLYDQLEELAEGLSRLQGSVPAVEELRQVASRLQDLGREVRFVEEERRNLRGLAGIGEVINSSLDLDVVLQIVMDTLIALTGAERGFLMLNSSPGEAQQPGELTIRTARNWEQESINPSDFAISRTLVRRVIDSGQSLLTTNAQEDPRFGAQESVVIHNLRSILCVPLVVKSTLIGVIYADHRVRSGIFTTHERDLLEAFADQAAVAIENARLFDSINRTLEEVTRLKNLMDNVLSSISSGVITLDENACVTLCNRATESILGCTAAQLMGRPLANSLPLLADRLEPGLRQVTARDQPVLNLDLRTAVPRGSQADLQVSLSPLKDASAATRGVAIVLNDLTEKNKLEAQRRLFERMVSPAVIQQLDPDSLQLGGQRKEITVLFADIRGFTGFTEGQDPETLVAVLNQHLAAAAEAVLAEEGTIDKFLGDAVMAWFNAPIPQDDHPLRAVRAAIRIRAAIQALHSTLPVPFHLSFGIGIHCGEAVLGLVGTQARLDYTAIGDCVNTAQRLQEAALGGQILISEEVRRGLDASVQVKASGTRRVRGKRAVLKVYEVIETQHSWSIP